MTQGDPTPGEPTPDQPTPPDAAQQAGGAGSGDHPGPAPVPAEEALGRPDEPDDRPVAAGPVEDVPEAEIELDAPVEPEVGDGAGVEQLRAALAAAEAQRDEYLEHLQRARADYDNLNKRKNRELAEALDRGAAMVVQQLLGVLDTFSYALDAARSTDDQQLAKGVQMVHDQLVRALRSAGLDEIPGAGEPFDPNLHEALMQVEADGDVDHPVVAEVLRTGYRFKGRVVRPASVKVAQ